MLGRVRCRDLVEAHGYLPHEKSLRLVRCCRRALHAAAPPAARRPGDLPAKLYEYLASGQPILAAVPDGDARDLLDGVDWTVLCAPDAVEGIYGALLSLVEQMPTRRGRRADRQALLPRLERPHLATELADTFDRVLAGSPLEVGRHVPAQ